MARQKRVGALSTLARVHDPGKGPSILRQQPFRRGTIRADRSVVATFAVLVVGRESPLPSFTEHEIDRLAVDPLEAQLLSDRSFAARVSTVTRLDPGPRERLVVEHPEVGHPRDRAIDKLAAVSGAGQPTTNFGHGPGPHLEEASGGLEHDRRVVDGRAPRPPLGERLATPLPTGHAGLLGLFDALDRDRDLGDLAADEAVDLRGDLGAGLEEVL
jgi:hypothetical protein